MTKKTVIMLKINDDMRETLDSMAKKEMRSRTNMVEKIVTDYLAGLAKPASPAHFEDI